MDFGQVFVTDISDPSGPGHAVNTTQTTGARTVFASFTPTFGNAFSAGVTVAVDFIEMDVNSTDYSSKASGHRFHVIGGVVGQAFGNVDLALTIRYANNPTLEYEWHSTFLQYGVPVTIEAGSPLRVGIGAMTEVVPGVDLVASAEYEHWTTVLQDARDLWQYHIGASATLIQGFTFRAGYFTQRYPWENPSNYFNQQFLTAGVAYEMGSGIRGSLSYITSEPLKKSPANFLYFPNPTGFFQNTISGGICWTL